MKTILICLFLIGIIFPNKPTNNISSVGNTKALDLENEDDCQCLDNSKVKFGEYVCIEGVRWRCRTDEETKKSVLQVTSETCDEEDKNCNNSLLLVNQNSLVVGSSTVMSEASLLQLVNSPTPVAREIVLNQQSRVRDKFGSGQYGASRDSGIRTHNGLDIIVTPGEKIYSPFTGNIIREAMPYRNDPSYLGIVLQGVDQWVGYEIKIFYVVGIFSGRASESQEIGSAQDLTVKYPGITNHIHLEVKYQGIQIDPFTLWQYSF